MFLSLQLESTIASSDTGRSFQPGLAGSTNVSSVSVPKPLDLTASTANKLHNRPKSAGSYSGNNLLVKSNAPFGFHSFSRGTVVGVANRSKSVEIKKAKTKAENKVNVVGRKEDKRSLLPLSPMGPSRTAPNRAYFDDNLVEIEVENSYYSSSDLPAVAPETDTPSALPQYRASASERDSHASYPNPTGQELENDILRRVKIRDNTEAWGDIYYDKADPAVLDSVDHHVIPDILVAPHHVVIHVRYRLMFGACADRLLRVWDLDCGEVICSCELTHSAADIRMMKKQSEDGLHQHDDSESSVSKLGLCEDSNHIVCGYDDGLVRVWVMGPHSTGQVRTVTVTDNGEMAIPPLQYHTEWLAHDTAISAVEIVCRARSGGGSSNFICTSGQAQGVYLWTLNGKIVGTFGGSEWVINDSLTWKPKAVDPIELKMIQDRFIPLKI